MPIQQEFNTDDFTEKIVAIDRIQSVTEQFILTGSSQESVIYWEYEGSLEDIARQLRQAKLIIDSRITKSGKC